MVQIKFYGCNSIHILSLSEYVAMLFKIFNEVTRIILHALK